MNEKRLLLLLRLAKEEKLLATLFDCLEEFLDRDVTMLANETDEECKEHNTIVHNELQVFYDEFINCEVSAEDANLKFLHNFYTILEDAEFYYNDLLKIPANDELQQCLQTIMIATSKFLYSSNK